MISELSVLFLLCVLTINIETARILAVFPTPSISHQVVFRPLTQQLARRGHEIVVITTDPAFSTGQSPVNLTEIDVHNLSYSKWNEFIAKSVDARDSLQQIEVILSVLASIFEEQMKTKDVKALFLSKNNNFDLLLLEACVRPALGLSHVFNVPVIQISSLGSGLNNHDVIGSSSHPLLYPAVIRDRIHNLTMWEKITQLKKEYQYIKLLKKTEINDYTIMQRIFGSEIPTFDELYERVEMLFLNVHPIWENNRPVPPGVVYMGGLHQNPQKELPKDLKTYLDSSKNGVIYFSLGTNVKTSNLASDTLQLIVNVFSRLPYDILWKWDSDELPGRSINIRISKWLPQSDLLRHPKIKLFITQGGLQSTDEAIAAGIPLIGIPMIADQWYNVEKYVQHKIGLKLDIHTLTEEKLETAIKTTINDQSYRQNIEELRKVIHDQPQSSLDRAVWWTEYVLRHGGARHLRSPAANISWAEFLELRLVLTLITISLVSLIIIYVIAKAIMNFIYLNFSFPIKIKKA